jgi:hypothetical protein
MAAVMFHRCFTCQYVIMHLLTFSMDLLPLNSKSAPLKLLNHILSLLNILEKN